MSSLLVLSRFLTHLIIDMGLAPGDAARSGSVQAVRRNLCAIRALRPQTVDIADLPLRQDVLAKTGSMNRSKTFRFGQQPVDFKRPDVE